MPETGDGTLGLANKPAPARARAPEVCAGSGVRASRPRARRRRAHLLRGAFLGEMRGNSRARAPLHPPAPLLPNWEKGKVGRPDA
jgi:hypothetical protein